MIIRIDTEVLRSGEKKLRALSEKIGTLREAAMNVSKKLNAAWDGGSSESVVSAVEEQGKELGTLAEEIAEAAVGLRDTAERFESADSSGAELKKMSAIHFAAVGVPVPTIKALLDNLFDSVRIVPDEVIACGKEYGDLVTRLDEVYADFKEQCEILRGTWEGNSYRNFQENSNSIVRAINVIREEMDKVGKRLIQIAERYLEVDSKIQF